MQGQDPAHQLAQNLTPCIEMDKPRWILVRKFEIYISKKYNLSNHAVIADICAGVPETRYWHIAKMLLVLHAKIIYFVEPADVTTAPIEIKIANLMK